MCEPFPFILPLAGRNPLTGLVHSSSRPGSRPTIVLCHGFKGFMEWGFFPYLAQLLADRGFTVVRFNFTGSGMRPGDTLVTDTEAFRNATFSRDLDDLGALLSALGQSIAPELVDHDRLGLFGHSRGGGCALLAAADPAWGSRIRCLVTWAAVSTFDRLPEAEKLLWRQRGEIPVVNSRTGQELMLDRRVLDDLLAQRDRLDLLAAAERRRMPWLLVHGQSDQTVPVTEARDLAEHAGGSGCLLEIPEGDHTFGATHPFRGPTPQLIAALNATQEWFRKELG